MKKCLILILSMVLVCSFLAASATADGSKALPIKYQKNKTITNNTGQDAYGFKMKFRYGDVPAGIGTWQLSALGYYYFQYTNTQHSGIYTTSYTYHSWSPSHVQEPVPPGGKVVLCYGYNVLPEVMWACWTDDQGDCIGYVNTLTQQVPVSPYIGPPWPALFQLTNCLEEAVSTTAENVSYTVLDRPLPHDSLIDENTELAGMLQLLPDGAGLHTIQPNDTLEFDVPGGLQPGNALICRFEGEGYIDYCQYQMQMRVPSVTPYGLIALVVLLIGTATWLYLRRRRKAVA
jgi:hypothetical protein